MICKYCGRSVPDESVYCLYCGERLARKKRTRSQERSYPKYRVLADGTLLGQLMVGGRRETVKAETEKAYRAKIDAIRAGVMELKAHPDRRPLKTVLRDYIDKNDGVLSPATIRGYEYILKGRFVSYMDKPAGQIDYQAMVNEEAKKHAPKTVENAWGLVTAAFRDAKIPVPEVNLPTVPESDEDFLDHDQILRFLPAIRGDSCELACLLALHSLRMSELLKLNVSDIRDGKIHVRGAMVRDKKNQLVEKKTNKSRSSTRVVDIMIPRISELLPASGPVVTVAAETIRKHSINACKKAGLPPCSPHDLRRSFASLGHFLQWDERTIMAVGGWSNMNTVHKIYIKLSQKDVSSDVQKMQNYYQITTGSSESADTNA